MFDVAFLILVTILYLTLFVWAIAYIITFGLGGFKGMVSEFSGFSLKGFSALRLAYFFTAINAILTPLHWLADWKGDENLLAAAFLLSLTTLISCFFVPRKAIGRFLPVAFSVIITINHALLCKA